MKNLKEVSEHIEEKANYLAEQLSNLTKKSIKLLITKEKGIITDLKLESIEGEEQK